MHCDYNVFTHECSHLSIVFSFQAEKQGFPSISVLLIFSATTAFVTAKIGDHLDQWQEHGNHDAADDDGQENNHDGFEQ
jgi:hypothetical protein